MPYGYNGKILRVDLDNGSIGIEEPPEILYSRYLEGGTLKGKKMDREQFSKALKTYCEMMGWEVETGVPKRGKLAELDLDWLS